MPRAGSVAGSDSIQYRRSSIRRNAATLKPLVVLDGDVRGMEGERTMVGASRLQIPRIVQLSESIAVRGESQEPVSLWLNSGLVPRAERAVVRLRRRRSTPSQPSLE